MKTLEEYNFEQLSSYLRLNSNTPVLNGIACPDCDEELYDSSPMTILTSNPPKKNVNCSKCGYVGYRIV